MAKSVTDILRENPQLAARIIELWEHVYVPSPMILWHRAWVKEWRFERRQLKQWKDDGGWYESRD